jgi:CRISPR-associated endoribonuclease Cas6
MRIKITLVVSGNGRIDFNYQHQIQAIIYQFLARSDPDYASWLHEQGYVYQRDQIFKLFVYSGIIFHGPIRMDGSFAFEGSPSRPFTFSFQIASPVNQFIQHLIDGIFIEGNEITLGPQRADIFRVETLPDPLNGTGNPLSSPFNKGGHDGVLSLNLKPLESPIFIKKPMPKGERDLYLFPGDEDYENLLNQNLIHKYETLYDRVYQGEPLRFKFLPAKDKAVKAFKVFKNGRVAGEIKGTLQSFSVSGPKDLIQIGLDCGFGQNNSLGCGYVEIVQTV